MGLLLLLLLGIVLGGYLVLFSLNNTYQVSLNLLVGNLYLHEVELWQLTLVCLAAGMALAALLLLPAQLRLSSKLHATRAELSRAQALLEAEYHKSATPANAKAIPAEVSTPAETS